MSGILFFIFASCEPLNWKAVGPLLEMNDFFITFFFFLYKWHELTSLIRNVGRDLLAQDVWYIWLFILLHDTL